MNDGQAIISFATIVIAILLRTLLPSLKKLQAGASWDHTYTATAILAFIVAFTSAAATFQTFTIPEGVTSILGIILLSFIYGWGLNDVLNTTLADLPSPSTPTVTGAQPPSSLLVSASTQAILGTYKGWTIKIVNGFLQLYPAAGGMYGLGSVIGYSTTYDFIGMATKYIDTITAIQTAQATTPPNPAIQQPTSG